MNKKEIDNFDKEEVEKLISNLIKIRQSGMGIVLTLLEEIEGVEGAIDE